MKLALFRVSEVTKLQKVKAQCTVAQQGEETREDTLKLKIQQQGYLTEVTQWALLAGNE